MSQYVKSYLNISLRWCFVHFQHVFNIDTWKTWQIWPKIQNLKIKMTPPHLIFAENCMLSPRNSQKLVFICIFHFNASYSIIKCTYNRVKMCFRKIMISLIGWRPPNTFSYIIHIDLCLIQRPFGSTFGEIQSDSHISLYRSVNAQSKNMEKMRGCV